MWNTIRDLVAAGSTVLLTTQYLEEADQLADRIAVIDNGRLVADGTADDLKAAVGASTLMVALSDPTAAGEAAAIVAGFTRTEVTVSGNGGVAAPLGDLSLMPELLFALRAAGIELREITVQKPSLDEVFFAITGQPAEVPAIEKDAA
jgi:ABC-2 type transport system ATP-binding protein